MIDKINFGKRIAALRRTKSLSQQQLAGRLGVTVQAVSKWECGNSLPDVELLLDLSHLYGVTVNEMLEERDLVYELTGQHVKRDGIAYFLPKKECEYNMDWAEKW